MKIRDRIRELRRVRASELRPNARNWRVHPEAQQNALRGVLAEIGIADALIARELADGSLELIDGHLRTDVSPDTEWPVLIVDLDDAEAAKLLTVHDPLAAMAESDSAKLESVLREIDTGNESLSDLLAQMAADAGVIPIDETPLPEIEETTRHTVVVPYDETDIPDLCRFLGVEALPARGLGKLLYDRIKAVVGET